MEIPLCIVDCETCVVFYFLPRAPSKLLANLQNKNQSCKIDSTAPSVLSYVVYPVLHL